MKAVDVNFKKMDIIEYYPQMDMVKVRLVYDDGTEIASIKQFSITDPDKHASDWVTDVRDKLKDKHKEESLDDHPLAGALILRIKQEEDVLQSKIARFLAQVREAIRSAKMGGLSYLDIENKVRKLKVNF